MAVEITWGAAEERHQKNHNRISTQHIDYGHMGKDCWIYKTDA